MTTVTIPKKLAKSGELIIVPRKEYEQLLELKKAMEFAPTSTEKKALAKAESNLKRGKSLTYNELERKLGFKS